MGFDTDNIDQALNGRYTAAFLGVSETTVRRLRDRGILPAFQVPSREPGAKAVWRYRYLDLHQFVKENGGYSRLAPPRFKHIFPVQAIADLLGVSAQDVRIQRHRGRLRGYDPVSVRNYLLRTSRKNLVREIRAEFHSKLSKLREEVRRLRRLLAKE